MAGQLVVGGRWRIQPTPGLVANDSGLVGVACPTVSACYAVGAYTTNGPTFASQPHPVRNRVTLTGPAAVEGSCRQPAARTWPGAVICAHLRGAAC